MLRPKILDTFIKYSPQKFLKDISAGVIVGIVALPLAIAFAIASGVTPEKGLYTAIIAGFIISAFGGSRVQIGGPTGAFVIIVYRIIEQYGFNALLISTMLAGVILIIMGLVKAGAVIKFIPHSVIVGFTAGIAFVIFTSQINDFLGLGLTKLPADFIKKITIVSQNIMDINLYSVLIACITLVIIIFWPANKFKIPGSLIAIVFASIIVVIFKLPVDTIGSQFGTIPNSLPMPVFPGFDWNEIPILIKPAFTIAILAAIESLLSAVVADGMIGGKHRSNMELVAQGVANIVTPLFGGIPATGAIARTATNIKNGGRTPVAGIVHTITLFLIMVYFGQFATKIPLACLAAILMIVAYNMSEWRTALSIIKTSKTFSFVMTATFFITVFVNLSTAIEIGLILAAIVFINEMMKSTQVSAISGSFLIDNDEGSLVLHETEELINKKIPKGVLIYEINGPLFFGAAYKFKEAISEIGPAPKVIIIRLRHVPMIDSTGLHMLKEVVNRFKKYKTQIILVGVRPQVMKIISNSNLLVVIGEENIVASLPQAIDLSNKLLVNQLELVISKKTKTI